MRLLQEESTLYRVADPDWEDPLDGSYSMRFGQRWNAKGSFPVTYLNANEATARANADVMIRKLIGVGIEIEDLEPAQLPVIVPCAVPERTVLDVLSDQGCLDVGLEDAYPGDADGAIVPQWRCQPIGQRAWDEGLHGISCRSAALLTPEGQELAWFDRPGSRLSPTGPPLPH
jgi:hypothetical protein